METPSGPFSLIDWVTQNKHLLKPPVSNQVLYGDVSKDFIVMVVGGPNARNDFHVNDGDEIFYQLAGQIVVRTIEEGKIVDNHLGPGDMLLVPGGRPHNPCRTADSVGLVIERPRKSGELDGFQWYCDQCGHQLHAHFAEITDIVNQLPPIMEAFQSNLDLRTCQQCGTVSPLPKPFV